MNFSSVLKKLGKWILRIIAAVACLAVAVLFIFRVSTFFRESKTPEQAAPPSGKFVSVNGKKIYIQETGPSSGTPVVFVHGFGAWSETWRKTLDVLAAQGFHAIAIDLPPFGFSEKVTDNTFSREDQAKRILGVLDALNLKQVVLVGHSVGGRPTVEFALNHLERIKALVLVDPALGFDKAGEFTQNNPAWWLKTIFAVHPLRNTILAATASNPLLTKKLFSGFVADPAVLTPEVLAIYQKPFVLKDGTNRFGDWLKFLLLDQDNSVSTDSKNFKNIKANTLIVWGGKDTVTPLWQGMLLNGLIPNSELATLAGLGHVPQIEDPEKFNQTLAAFLLKIK